MPVKKKPGKYPRRSIPVDRTVAPIDPVIKNALSETDLDPPDTGDEADWEDVLCSDDQEFLSQLREENHYLANNRAGKLDDTQEFDTYRSPDDDLATGGLAF